MLAESACQFFYQVLNAVSDGAFKENATAVMAGNNTFQQKSITQNRKTFITQPKHMKTYDLVLLFLQKNLIFVLCVTHEDPIFAQVKPKKW